MIHFYQCFSNFLASGLFSFCPLRTLLDDCKHLSVSICWRHKSPIKSNAIFVTALTLGQFVKNLKYYDRHCLTWKMRSWGSGEACVMLAHPWTRVMKMRLAKGMWDATCGGSRLVRYCQDIGYLHPPTPKQHLLAWKECWLRCIRAREEWRAEVTWRKHWPAGVAASLDKHKGWNIYEW